jgi:prepilin-type N-terminal cleavage/methylation domain-containing protein
MVFKFNVNKGFTLIEILVVISIIAITTGAVVINSTSSTSDIDLFSAKNSIIVNISKAKEMALSGVGATPGTNYGIGVWFEDPNGKYYYIYRNEGADKGYDLGDVILEKVVLPKGIKYQRSGTNTQIGVLFTPPTPVIDICSTASVCTGTLFEINVLKEDGGGSTHIIEVNKAGLIE